MKSSHNYLSLNRILFAFVTVFLLLLLTSQETFGQTTKSLSLTWTATGDDGSTGTATAYDIRYSTSVITNENWINAIQLANEPTPQSAGSTESFVVDSLEPNTTYYFAIKSADEAFNWSLISNVISKTTTSESIPPATIASLVVIDSTDGSVSLSWTAPGDDGTNGTASLYEVRYSTSPITMSNWSSATVASNPPTPVLAGGLQSIIITGLIQETTYFFAIRTADEVPNWSDISNVVSTSTIDLTPPAAVTDLTAITGTTNGTISLNWTAPGDDSLSGFVAVYEIRYSQNEITDLNWLETSLLVTPPPPLQAGEQQSITLTGLIPGQMYFTALKSYDSSGNASTLSNVPSAEAAFNLATDIDETDNNLPTEFALEQNYPNPFNPSTTIGFALPIASFVEVSIYNIEGRIVKTLVEKKLQAGQHTIEWDGTNNAGSQIATGAYIYRMTTETFSTTKKMVLLK